MESGRMAFGQKNERMAGFKWPASEPENGESAGVKMSGTIYPEQLTRLNQPV
jgi:hypothetical protein